MLALTGALLLLARSGDELSLAWFMLSLAVFLLGMGLANPLGSALALQPFGRQAGLASALLGFLQMGCAACATTIATLLPLPSATALGAVLATSTGLALGLLMIHGRGRRPDAPIGSPERLVAKTKAQALDVWEPRWRRLRWQSTRSLGRPRIGCRLWLALPNTAEASAAMSRRHDYCACSPRRVAI